MSEDTTTLDELGTDDTVELAEESSKEEVIELSDDKAEKTEEPIKLEAEDKEDEKEEDTDDEDELVIPVRKKEILAKYPTLFKDFPYLEKAYYREQKYAELLPTIADAETAVEKSNALDQYEAKLLSGSTEDILRAVKADNEEAFNLIVDNYLPSLEAVDSNAYYHIIGNIIKHTIATMVGEKNDDLTEAARVLNKYVFGKNEYEKPGRLSKDEAKDTKINEREQQFVQRQFNSVRNDLNNKVSNILTSTIDKNIDPKESMTDYVRKHAITEAMNHLDESISQDTRFVALLDKLWERAMSDDFSPQSIDKIRSAYLSKAKTLLPSVIKKARIDALQGLGKKITDDEVVDKKGPLPVGNTRKSTSSSGKTDKDRARALPKDVSSLDYLMQD